MKTFNKITPVLLLSGAATALAFCFFSHENPLLTQPKMKAAAFICSASEKELGSQIYENCLVNPMHYSSAFISDPAKAKASGEAYCEKNREKMVQYAKEHSAFAAFKNITVNDLKSEKALARLKPLLEPHLTSKGLVFNGPAECKIDM